MKQTLTALLLLASVGFFSSEAAASSYISRMGSKLGNGITNAVTGIVEVPKTIMATNRTDGPAYAATAGVVTGLFNMIGRTLLGAGDVVTFMIPTKPIPQPDFVWQNFKQETTYRKTWELLP